MKSGMENNMFSPNHYVPILKWKRAELRALQGLKDHDKERITPLIELVMPKVSSPYKDKAKKIRKTTDEIFVEVVLKFKTQRAKDIPKEVQSAWGDAPIFLDFSLLYEAQFTTRLKVESMKEIISAGATLGLRLIPVINLNDEREIKHTACTLSKQYGQGLCLRVALSDLDDMDKLNQKLEACLKSFDVFERNIDLLIDLKDISQESNQYVHCVNVSQQLRSIAKWRNLIIAAGSFPEDLTDCKFDEATFIPRLEWKGWLSHAHAKPLKRIPTFADYTIRNPIFKESSQFYPPTTSIRYTQEETWMVMKGKKLKFHMYLANAKLLAGSSEHFYGKTFSDGDRYVSDKADHYDAYIKNPGIKGTGGSEDWIYAGINHHLVLVARQIAKLP
jgi:Beta protein